MHTFQALLATGFDTSEVEVQDAFCNEFGDIGRADYLAGRWDVQTLVRRSIDGERVYMSLEAWRLNPWRALAKVGCKNVNALKENVSYDCIVSGNVSYAFVPTGIETTKEGLAKYKENYDRMPLDSLECLCSTAHFHGADNDMGEFLLTRFQHCIVGSGYSEMCLPDDGDTQLEPVYVQLDNGDRLLGFAFNFYGQ